MTFEQIYADELGELYASHLRAWWLKHTSGAVPLEILPGDGAYIVRDTFSEPLAAAFVYYEANGVTFTGVAFLAWTIGDPARPEEMFGAVGFLLANVAAEAKGRGFRVIMTSTSNKVMKECFSRAGWPEGDTGASHFILTL